MGGARRREAADVTLGLSGRISPFRPSIVTIVAALLATAAVMIFGGLAAGGQLPLPGPRGLTVAATQTSLTLSWGVTPGVTKYETYLDGTKAGETATGSWSYTGLTCGTSHVLQVDAVYRFGTSAKSSTDASTSSCSAKQPDVSGFAPTSGPVGTSVTITGFSFTGATGVAFNGTPATYNVSSDTQIVALVPTGATTGKISVTGPGGTGRSAASFTVTVNGPPPPSIASFSPSSGPAGTSVSINGAGFTGATSVAFNGSNASFSVVSDTQITATVPSSASSGPIKVTAPGGSVTSASSFTVTSGSSNLYLSPSGSDKNPCTSSAPCLTFGRAYQAASPGAVVQVTCGGASSCSYPAQDIPYQVAKSGSFRCRAAETFPDGQQTSNDTSGCVTFQPPPGSFPTIASAAVEVPYVQLDGLTFKSGVFAGTDLARANAACSAWNVHDVIFRNLMATDFTVDDASYVFVVGGSYGPLFNQASHVNGCKDAAGNYAQGSHLALDGITMHDYRQTVQGAHMECIHFQASDNSVVVNSRFLNCGQQDISFQTNLLVSSINGLLIQNNIFDAACSHAQPGDNCAVVSGGTTTFICSDTGERLANVSMRFNTLNGSPSFQPQQNCSMSGIALSGNILTGPSSSWACSRIQSAGVSYSYNAFTNATGVTCGTGNVLGVLPSTTWVDPSNYDYQLLSGSPAINLTPMSLTHPSTDIVGLARPQQVTPDAGAYEYH